MQVLVWKDILEMALDGGVICDDRNVQLEGRLVFNKWGPLEGKVRSFSAKEYEDSAQLKLMGDLISFRKLGVTLSTGSMESCSQYFLFGTPLMHCAESDHDLGRDRAAHEARDARVLTAIDGSAWWPATGGDKNRAADNDGNPPPLLWQ